MTEWHDQVLATVLCQDSPLFVAFDPDLLLLDEQIFQTLRANHFDLLTYTDPIAFRHAYEPNYREPRDNGRETPRLIVRFPHTRRESVPYDLLQQSECIQISLSELFPGLDYKTVQTLGPQYYDALFEAAHKIRGKRFGRKHTAAFILDQVFSIRPNDIRTSTDLIALFCRVHYHHQTIPPILIDHCLEIWTDRHFAGLPEIRDLFDHDTFMAYLQDEWARYIGGNGQASTVPFDHDQIRLYIDTFFLEGALKPLRVPPSVLVPQWAHCGIVHDQETEQLYRLNFLLDRILKNLPSPDTRLNDWKQYARLWAEAVVLFSALSPSMTPDQVKTRYHTLHQTLETTFKDWLIKTFPTLPDRPYLPAPVMVHQIPHYLAHHAGERTALIVMDGMALDQWLIVKEMLGDDFTYTEDLVCAWVPTLTSISRRSLFAGEKPSFVSGVNKKPLSEENLWRTFWHNQSRPERDIGYSRGNTLVSDAEADELVHDATPRIAGFVINTIDNLMHRSMMGMPQMHLDVRHWVETGTLRRFITRLLDRGYQVYITADHGNICTPGMGVPKQGDLVDETSARARIYDHASFAEEAHQAFPEDSCVWPSNYLGTGHAVLLADGLKAFFKPDEEILSHGSISMEEVFVPFVQIRSAQQCHR